MMIPLEHVPDGITIQKQETTLQVLLHNKDSKHLLYIIIHAIGLGYIIFLEVVLILDFLENWQQNCSSWILILCYALQDLIFLWIVKEMILAIGRLIKSQERTLQICLKKDGFSIQLYNRHQITLPKQWYQKEQVQAIYYNRGSQQRESDIKASLLNIPYKLYIEQHQQIPKGWGEFLREEQLYFLVYMLQDIYIHGRGEWPFEEV